MSKIISMLLLLLLLDRGPVLAQVTAAIRPLRVPAAMLTMEQESSASPWKLVAGVLGGAIGFGALYYGLKPGPPNPDAEFVSEEDVRDAGAWAGMSLGIPIGTHLANAWRGSLGWSLVASLGIGVLGAVLTTTQDSSVFLVLTPAAQIWASAEITRSGSR